MNKIGIFGTQFSGLGNFLIIYIENRPVFHNFCKLSTVFPKLSTGVERGKMMIDYN